MPPAPSTGRRCPECGSPMHALKERHEPRGTTVVLVCRSGVCASVQRGFPAKLTVFAPEQS